MRRCCLRSAWSILRLPSPPLASSPNRPTLILGLRGGDTQRHNLKRIHLQRQDHHRRPFPDLVVTVLPPPTGLLLFRPTLGTRSSLSLRFSAPLGQTKWTWRSRTTPNSRQPQNVLSLMLHRVFTPEAVTNCIAAGPSPTGAPVGCRPMALRVAGVRRLTCRPSRSHARHAGASRPRAINGQLRRHDERLTLRPCPRKAARARWPTRISTSLVSSVCLPRKTRTTMTRNCRAIERASVIS